MGKAAMIIFIFQWSLKQINCYSASIISLSLSVAAGRSAGFHLLSLLTGLDDDYCANWVWDQVIITCNWEYEPYHSFCHSHGKCKDKNMFRMTVFSVKFILKALMENHDMIPEILVRYS